MLLLRNPIQPYAWGAIDGIADVVGSAPTGERQAELWVGTHPRGPSVVAAGPHEGQTLAEVIAEDPGRWLGPELAAAGRRALPFLLKVLAIDAPLSLQAHPSADQAAAGFASEEGAGVPLDAPERNYRDASPKPEALVALRDSWALCGFRPADEIGALLGELGVAQLEPWVARLAAAGSEREAGEARRDLLAFLLRLDGADRTALAGEVAQAVASAPPAPSPTPQAWVRALVESYPGDPLALAPFVLNVVALRPGDAVHLPAGNLHAYLRGAGVEIMAASDNVLRGGLTPKHVDVDELLAVLRFDAGLPAAPRRSEVGPGVHPYDAGEEAFALVAIDAALGPIELVPSAPSLLLATGGPVKVAGPDETMVLDGGLAAFVPPGGVAYRASGQGQLWWATTGAGLPR